MKDIGSGLAWLGFWLCLGMGCQKQEIIHEYKYTPKVEHINGSSNRT